MFQHRTTPCPLNLGLRWTDGSIGRLALAERIAPAPATAGPVSGRFLLLYWMDPCQARVRVHNGRFCRYCFLIVQQLESFVRPQRAHKMHRNSVGGGSSSSVSSAGSSSLSSQARLKYPSRPVASSHQQAVASLLPRSSSGLLLQQQTANAKAQKTSLSTSEGNGVLNISSQVMRKSEDFWAPFMVEKAVQHDAEKRIGTNVAVDCNTFNDEIAEVSRRFELEKDALTTHYVEQLRAKEAALADMRKRVVVSSASTCRTVQTEHYEIQSECRSEKNVHDMGAQTTSSTDVPQAEQDNALAGRASALLFCAAVGSPLPDYTTHCPGGICLSQPNKARSVVEAGVCTEPKMPVHDVGTATALEVSHALSGQIDTSTKHTVPSTEIELLRLELQGLRKLASENYSKYEAATALAAQQMEKYEVCKRENTRLHDLVDRLQEKHRLDRKMLETTIDLLNQEIVQVRRACAEEVEKRQKMFSDHNLIAGFKDLQQQYESLRDQYYIKTTALEAENRLLRSNLGDSFELVMMEELRLMRDAFDLKLKESAKQMKDMQIEHAQTMAALQETFRSERRIMDGRIRQLKAKLGET